MCDRAVNVKVAVPEGVSDLGVRDGRVGAEDGLDLSKGLGHLGWWADMSAWFERGVCVIRRGEESGPCCSDVMSSARGVVGQVRGKRTAVEAEGVQQAYRSSCHWRQRHRHRAHLDAGKLVSPRRARREGEGSGSGRTCEVEVLDGAVAGLRADMHEPVDRVQLAP